jgi:hypothetical protein
MLAVMINQKTALDDTLDKKAVFGYRFPVKESCTFLTWCIQNVAI